MIAGCGSLADKPEIAGCHWSFSIFGAVLYTNNTGEEIAVFNGGMPGEAQVCVFTDPMRFGCQYRETNQEVLTALATYAKNNPRTLGCKP